MKIVRIPYRVNGVLHVKPRQKSDIYLHVPETRQSIASRRRKAAHAMKGATND